MAPTKEQRAVLEIVDRSLQSYAPEIRVPLLLEPAQLLGMLTKGINRNPEWFYVQSFSMAHTATEGMIYPHYLYPRQQAQRLQARCESTVYRLIGRIRAAGEYERVLQAHDLLCRNVLYEKSGERDTHSIVGPFVRKRAVCEGFSKALKYMLNRMKIPCLIVVGDVAEGCHAWNMVCLDGKWTHIDLTYDAAYSRSGVQRYDYFGLTAQEIRRDHSFPQDDYPAADCPDFGYYRRNGLLVQSREELKKRIRQGLLTGQTNFVFQLPADTAEEELRSELRAILSGSFLVGTYTLSTDIARRVFHLRLNR